MAKYFGLFGDADFPDSDDDLEPVVPTPANTVVQHGQDTGNEIPQQKEPTPVVTTNEHGEEGATEIQSISELVEPNNATQTSGLVLYSDTDSESSETPDPDELGMDTRTVDTEAKNSETPEEQGMDTRAADTEPENPETPEGQRMETRAAADAEPGDLETPEGQGMGTRAADVEPENSETPEEQGMDTRAADVEPKNSETPEEQGMDTRAAADTDCEPEILETEETQNENITSLPPVTKTNILELDLESHPPVVRVPIPDIPDIDQLQIKDEQQDKNTDPRTADTEPENAETPDPEEVGMDAETEILEPEELGMDTQTADAETEILNVTSPPPVTKIENILELESQSHPPVVPISEIGDIDQCTIKNEQQEKNADPNRIQDNMEIPVANVQEDFGMGSLMNPVMEIQNQLEMAASSPVAPQPPAFHLTTPPYQSTLLNIRNRVEGIHYLGVMRVMDGARAEYCDGKTKGLSIAPPYVIEDAILDAYENKQYSLLFAILLDVEGVHNMKLQSRNGKTLLHLAAEDKQLDVVVLLCSMQPDLRILDNDGLTPLLRAIQADQPEIALYLISFGSDPFEETINGDNAIHFAMKSRNFNTFKQLVTLRPEFVNLTHSRTGLTPIMMALQHNLATEAQYLIREWKADLRLIDPVAGNTSLHFCAFGGALGLVDLVIEYGGHYLLSVTNKFGETPLEVAMNQTQDRMTVLLGRKNFQYGRLEIVSSDISNGQETKPILCINEFDSTPLPTREFQYMKELNSGTKIVLSSLRPLQQVIPKPCLCSARPKSAKKNLNRLTYDGHGRIFTDCVIQNGPPVPLNIYECNVNCRCAPKNCTNRSTKNGIQLPLQIFRQDPRLANPKISTKLWGLQCLSRISKGSFICEFIGEIITKKDPQFKERVDDDVRKHYGVVRSVLEDVYCISTRLRGNVSHYINHSVNPNAGLVYVYEENCAFEHEPRICVFASRDIEIEEEITLDWYNQDLTFSPSQSRN